MSSSVWVLAALLVGALFGLVVRALARRRASRPVSPRVELVAAEPASISGPAPEPPTPEHAPAAAGVANLEPVPLDPIEVTARDMAKSAYDIAQHLGFDAMPDRAQPSVRKLRVPLRNDLERRAAMLLASGAHPCVPRVEITRDERHALTFVDLSALPPT